MSSFQELRNLALEARRENTNDRQDRYIKARDEAFEVLTDGIMEKITSAAKKGKFRYAIYRWTNQPRHKQSEEVSSPVVVGEDGDTPEASQLIFGNDESGKNGLHIMALIQPVGIPFNMTLGYKLHQFFNVRPEGETGPLTEEEKRERRENQLKVFFQRRPENLSKCAIYVSWEKQHIYDGKRPQSSQYTPRQPRHEQPVLVEQIERPVYTARPNQQSPERVQRGTAPLRGRGRGRGGAFGASRS